MYQVVTSDLSFTQGERRLREARFGDRTRYPEFGWTRKLWRFDDGRWRRKRCRKRFGLFTDTPLARESFEPAEILELLY